MNRFVVFMQENWGWIVSVGGILGVNAAPAVLDEPCAVFRRLMSLDKVLLRVIVIPADDRHGVVRSGVVPGIVRPLIADVDAFFIKRLVGTPTVCLETDRDAALFQKLHLDLLRRLGVVMVLVLFVALCGRRQDVRIHEDEMQLRSGCTDKSLSRR